jgi:hypothetical protein
LEARVLLVLSQFKVETVVTASSVRLPALGEAEAAETSTETQPVKTAVQAVVVDYLTVRQVRQVLAVKETQAARELLMTQARAAAVQVRPVQTRQQLTAGLVETVLLQALTEPPRLEPVVVEAVQVQAVEPVAVVELVAVVKVVILELLILLQEQQTLAEAAVEVQLQFLEMVQPVAQVS